jgi:hypothetical protein
MVQLVVHLTNPSSRLQVVLDAFPHGAPKRTPGQEPIVPQPALKRLGNGIVKQAVIEVLTKAGRPMRRAEVQQAVEALLGQPVAESSIDYCLYTGTRGPRPLIERTKPGWHRIKH